MTKVWTLVDRYYTTQTEAIAAQESLLIAGCPIGECPIEEREIGEKDHRGVELLAEQRNSLIDFSGDEKTQERMKRREYWQQQFKKSDPRH